MTIDGGKGNDSIQNVTSSNATINGVSKAFNVLFVYNGGNDYIAGFDNTSALKIASGEMNSVFNTNGSDYFLTVGENVITLVGAAALEKVNIVTGKSKAVKFNVNANILGTEDRDTIYNCIDGATINSGAGSDSIRNNYSNVSINSGTGNDSIFNYYGENVLFVYSGGNDTIDGLNSSSTVQIASGKPDSVVQSNGSDYFLTVGKNFVTLKGAAYYRDKVNIVDAKGKAIYFTVRDITVRNEKNKRIYNDDASQVTMNGGTGNDTIYSLSDSVTMNGGAGDDTVGSGGSNVTMKGGDGNDFIYSSSSNSVTIEAGAGDDSIRNDGSQVLFAYRAGDGNDSIVGFNEDDTLQIAASKYSTKTSGDDIIVTVGKGKITPGGAASLSGVNIDFDKLLVVDNETSSPVTVDSKTKIIDGTKRTRAVKITGNDTLWGGAGN